MEEKTQSLEYFLTDDNSVIINTERKTCRMVIKYPDFSLYSTYTYHYLSYQFCINSIENTAENPGRTSYLLLVKIDTNKRNPPIGERPPGMIRYICMHKYVDNIPFELGFMEEIRELKTYKKVIYGLSDHCIHILRPLLGHTIIRDENIDEIEQIKDYTDTYQTAKFTFNAF